jgi:hypothetical protein
MIGGKHVANIDELARRPAAYRFETGVPQLTGGLIIFLLGASDLVQHFLPVTFAAQEAPGWLAICGAVAVLWGAKMLNERVVFPRGGYVEVLRQTWSLTDIALVVGLITFILLIHLASPEGRLMAPGFAILFAIIALASGLRDKSAPVTCFGVYLLCVAPVLWALPITRVEQDALLEVGAGAPLAVGGAFILRRFLNANPKRPEMANG